MDNKKYVHKIQTCNKTMESIICDCKVWAKEISETYEPDLMVFIAKSGFLFAKPMAEIMKCEMADIVAARPASGKKDRLSKLIRLVPEKIILKILATPLMYKFNERKGERNITTTKKFEEEKLKEHKRILIIDDSVDTGLTLQGVLEEVKKGFPKAEIKTATYSVIQYSKGRIKVDYYRYENVIVLTATSRKSKEYQDFLSAYYDWVENQGNEQQEY